MFGDDPLELIEARVSDHNPSIALAGRDDSNVGAEQIGKLFFKPRDIRIVAFAVPAFFLAACERREALVREAFRIANR